jgi:hypothetical protein
VRSRLKGTQPSREMITLLNMRQGARISTGLNVSKAFTWLAQTKEELRIEQNRTVQYAPTRIG